MEQFNLDLAFSKVGAYGRAQWLLTFVCCILRNSGSYVFYPFAYLTMEQQFLCTDGQSEYSSCS